MVNKGRNASKEEADLSLPLRADISPPKSKGAFQNLKNLLNKVVLGWIPANRQTIMKSQTYRHRFSTTAYKTIIKN